MADCVSLFSHARQFRVWYNYGIMKANKTGMRRILALAALSAAVVSGCATNNGSCARVSSRSKPLAKHVVLIGVDGLGARWLPWDRMPNLSQLRQDGLYAVGRSCFPTASAINWATALYGTIVEIHGYRNWNSKSPDLPPPLAAMDGERLPCIFSEIRRQEPSAYTVSLFTWDGIGNCHNTNTVTFAKQFPGGGGAAYASRDKSVIEYGLEQIAKKPKLLFVYNGQPDSMGHGHGWGSPEFTNACESVDAGIGRIVDGVKKAGLFDDTVFVFVADHGGDGKKHGMATLNCFDVPFLVSGPAVKNLRLREPVLLADTAPTIADILGYEIPECWRGRSALCEK